MWPMEMVWRAVEALESARRRGNHSGPYYSTISDKGDDKGPEASTQIQECSNETPYRMPKWQLFLSALPWVTTVLFVVLYLAAALQNRHRKAQYGTYESGWTTDFQPLAKEIELTRTRFTGSPTYSDDGRFYVPNPDPVKYVGNPSPEIDAAWKELTFGRYILITESEAKDTWGEEYINYWDYRRGGYVAGIDMFHTLHCVWTLYKIIHPEYYPSPNWTDPGEMIHQHHCIEQIRQYIMCAGDITPIPTKYNAFVNKNYVDSDVEHSCRDFGQIRQWVTERYIGDTRVHGHPDQSGPPKPN